MLVHNRHHHLLTSSKTYPLAKVVGRDGPRRLETITSHRGISLLFPVRAVRGSFGIDLADRLLTTLGAGVRSGQDGRDNEKPVQESQHKLHGVCLVLALICGILPQAEHELT